MNLIVDIGNSSAKAAVFNGNEMVAHKRLTANMVDGIAMLTADYDIKACAFSSVGTPRPDVALHRLFATTLLPILSVQTD